MINESPYFRNLHDTLIAANRKALVHSNSKAKGSAKAWDNVKAKNAKRMRPRGKVYNRLMAIQRKADWEKLQRDTQLPIRQLIQQGEKIDVRADS